MYTIMICSSVPFALSRLKAVIFYLCITATYQFYLDLLYFQRTIFPIDQVNRWNVQEF